MRFKRPILFLLSVFYAYAAFAQVQGELTQSRILILLDESSSMIQSWPGGMEKYKAADSLILKLMDSVYAVNSDVEFSLRVFGHQHTVEEKNCYDTRNEVPFSKDNRTQMSFRLADIRPLGVTPIAYALEQAAEYDLTDEGHNAYSIILITDGGESCGGDICEVMRKLLKSKVFFKPYIVSLENDPVLRTTYSCMGDYLQVTRKSDIAQAVSTIVTAFTPAIKITKEEYKQMQSITANAPSVLKMNIPVTVNEPVAAIPPVTVPVEAAVPEPVKKNRDTIIAKVLNPKPSPTPVTVKPKQPVHDTVVDPPVRSVHHIIVDAPVHQEAMKLTKLDPLPLHSFNTFSGTPPLKARISPVQVSLPPIPQADKVAATPIVAVVPKPINPSLTRLKPARLKTFNVLFIVEDRTFTQRTVPPLPPIKFEEPKINSRIPIPRLQPIPPGKKGGYTLETEDAKETSLAIYFTDGLGKFYSTTPQMLIIDPQSNKVIRKFYRTVDAGGEPDPQASIPVGMYDIAVSGSRSLIIHDVDIIKDKKNKLIIKIKKCSLKFQYQDAAQRPVKEFSAIVTERDKTQGKVVLQKCTEELTYEPGNYHIVINTFPEDTRNVDLDLDDETVITIPQPGFAKFSVPEARALAASLYVKRGDHYLNFYTVDLNDIGSQHLALQPGEYQAHYHKGSGSVEKVLPFIIKATQESEVILK